MNTVAESLIIQASLFTDFCQGADVMQALTAGWENIQKRNQVNWNYGNFSGTEEVLNGEGKWFTFKKLP